MRRRGRIAPVGLGVTFTLNRGASAVARLGGGATVQPRLVAHGQRRRPRFFVGALQLAEDRVHPVAHAVHRRRHLVAGRSQLLYLDPHLATPRRQVGQHASACLLDLFEQGATLVLGLGQDGVALGRGLGQDPVALGPRLGLGVGHEQLHLPHPLGRRCLRTGLQLLDLLLRVAQHGRRPLLRLGDDPGGLLVGVAEDLGAVLAERRRQRCLFDHRVRGPLLRVGQGRAQLLLVLLEGLHAARHRLQVCPHLVRVEAAPDDGEGVSGDVACCDP